MEGNTTECLEIEIGGILHDRGQQDGHDLPHQPQDNFQDFAMIEVKL
jgi:hypothetical protein